MKSAFSFLPHWPPAPNAVFWIGLMLLIAGLCGELCWRTWRLPRLIGYSMVGLIAGPAGFGVINKALAVYARPLMDVALGLLLFEFGSRLSVRWIRTNSWLVATSVSEAALTFIAVITVLRLMHFPLMTAAVAASIAMATSPAIVAQLKSELGSEGQVTERLLALTALNSMYAVVLLKLLSAWLHKAYYRDLLAAIAEPLYLIIGSLAVAYALARSCRHVKMQEEYSFAILIGLVLLAVAITHMLELSTMLALLAAGIILKNLDQRPQLWPAHFGTAGWLLTVFLFATTLLSFRWDYLPLGGLAALALIAARFVAKFAAVLIFAKPSGIDLKQGAALGLSLSPMSALAYLLVDDTYQFYPHFDPALRAIILCAIVVLQILTPLLACWGLAFTSERKQ